MVSFSKSIISCILFICCEHNAGKEWLLVDFIRSKRKKAIHELNPHTCLLSDACYPKNDFILFRCCFLIVTVQIIRMAFICFRFYISSMKYLYMCKAVRWNQCFLWARLRGWESILMTRGYFFNLLFQLDFIYTYINVNVNSNCLSIYDAIKRRKIYGITICRTGKNPDKE